MVRMPTRFRHAAIVGKYQAQGIRPLLEDVAGFLMSLGLEVSLEADTALNTGITDHDALTPAEMGRRCDLGVVVGGDGTMLGIARELARHDLPLVGINQGRLGFITDVPLAHYRETLRSMVAGDYEEEHRTMIEGGVWRDGQSIFQGLSLALRHREKRCFAVFGKGRQIDKKRPLGPAPQTGIRVDLQKHQFFPAQQRFRRSRFVRIH